MLEALGIILKDVNVCIYLIFLIEENEFSNLLEKKDSKISNKNLQDGYLGFIVIRPIPRTFIGRTCIKTYPEKNGRNFPIKRKYDVNLFGINLIIDSLAYQEQDTNVAACATSSLWSAFHKTGHLFHHEIPSPVSITRYATKFLPNVNRNFPNEGLTPEEMANAIRNVNLEPLFFRILRNSWLKGVIYSYLRGNIPVIFGIGLYEIMNNGNYEFLGKHAITITGFKIDNRISSQLEGLDLYLKARKIDKIYVHDDQIGPYAKMEFDKVRITTKQNNEDITYDSLSTTWPDNKEKDKVRAVPDILLIPLYHKIRVTYNTILEIVFEFNKLLNKITSYFKINLPTFEWDIFLTTNSEFKGDIIRNSQVEAAYCRELLTENNPRFMWRAIAYDSDKPSFELLFDATDIRQGDIFLRTIYYNIKTANTLIELSKNLDFNRLKTGRNSVIFRWIKDNSKS